MSSSRDSDSSGNRRDSSRPSSLQDKVRSLTLGFGLPQPETSSSIRHGRQRDSEVPWVPSPEISSIFRHLEKSRPLSERKSAAENVGSNIRSFTSEAFAQLWPIAEDLYEEEASLELRQVGFILLKSCLRSDTISPSQRLTIYRKASVPIDSSRLEDQIHVLEALTNNGQNIRPFARPLIGFLCEILGPQYNATLDARRVNKQEDNKVRIPEARGLYALLNLIANIIKADSEAVDGHELDVIIQISVQIARMAPWQREMKAAVAVIKAVTSNLGKPTPHLHLCVELLAAIATRDFTASDMAWESLLDRLKSSQWNQVVEILITTMISTWEGQGGSKADGALQMIIYLVCKNGTSNLPKISLPELFTCLLKAECTSRRQTRNRLHAIMKLLELAEVTDYLLKGSHWAPFLEVISHTANVLKFTADQGPPGTVVELPTAESSSNPSETGSISGSELADGKPEEAQKVVNDLVEGLKKCVKVIVSLWPEMSESQRNNAAELLYRMPDKPADETEALMALYMKDQPLLSPGTKGWIETLARIVTSCLGNAEVDTGTRLSCILALRNAVPKMQLNDDLSAFRELVFDFLRTFNPQAERDYRIINAFAFFIFLYMDSLQVHDFEALQLLLRPLLSAQIAPDVNVTSVSGVRQWEPSRISNELPSYLVACFNTYCTSSAEKARILYKTLLNIAKLQDPGNPGFPAEVRLTAAKALAKIRCNINNQICFAPEADTLKLAAAIGRVRTSSEEVDASLQPTKSTTADTISTIEPDIISLMDDYLVNCVSRAGMTAQVSPSAKTVMRPAKHTDSEAGAKSPLWMYPEHPGLPKARDYEPSEMVQQHTQGADEQKALRLSDWLAEMIKILQQESDWEVYSYILVHLPSQLSNPKLFSNAIPHIRMLRSVITHQLQTGVFMDPPAHTGLKKGDVAYCLFHILIMLLGYNDHFERAEQDDLVKTFLVGIEKWDRVYSLCIQGLSICCHTVPISVTRSLTAILQKMVMIITRSYLAVDILEFLAGLARLREVYVNLREEELRLIFALCVRHLQHLRDQRQKQSSNAEPVGRQTNRVSGASGESIPAKASSNIIDAQYDLPLYGFALSYHVLTIWFMSIRLVDRAKHVGWITDHLSSKDAQGRDILEEQSQVTLDMMHRTAYLDLGETSPGPVFDHSEGEVLKKSWLLGLSIVTVETAAGTGKSYIIKRQASGTTYAIYQQLTAPLPAHHVAPPSDVMSSFSGEESRVNILPNHVFLQLHSTIAPTPAPMEAICLPDDEATRRAISAFDRNDTVDGYKVSVIYVGHKQTKEAEILANTQASDAFQRLLEDMGTRMPLRGAKFNTQGLDRESNTDGEYCYAWRDRITEIVFHIPTLMPTDLENDAACNNKKRHIGNDYVNIIFNDSSLPFDFNTFPSQFNYVNIVITPEKFPIPDLPNPRPSMERAQSADSLYKFPEKQQHFTVHTISKPSFPKITACSTLKLLPLSQLGPLVRQIALNSCVFSNVWAHREGGEHISAWRNRLREIKKLRERFVGTGTSASEKYPGAKGERKYGEGDEFMGTVVMGGIAGGEEGIVSALDFSRWAGPNPPLG
jgi:hypothetical protein